MTDPRNHVPVAAGPAYADQIQRLPSKFTATLVAEPDNRFNHAAVAVHASGGKIGYLPPDVSRHYFDARLQPGLLQSVTDAIDRRVEAGIAGNAPVLIHEGDDLHGGRAVNPVLQRLVGALGARWNRRRRRWLCGA